jgi:S-adenosylmethionine synthetase
LRSSRTGKQVNPLLKGNVRGQIGAEAEAGENRNERSTINIKAEAGREADQENAKTANIRKVIEEVLLHNLLHPQKSNQIRNPFRLRTPNHRNLNRKR